MSRFAAKLSKIWNLLYTRVIRWGDRRGAGRSTESRHRFRALFFAIVLILWLPATGVVAVGAVGAKDTPDHAGERGPPGHAAVQNVEVGTTNGKQAGLKGASASSGSSGPPENAAAWNVSASHSAESLEVVIDIGDGSGDELNLRLTDEKAHEGRDVAIDADAVEAAVGGHPSTIYGRHAETGEGWTRSVTYEDGSAIFEVPHFSTQEVTFSGGISLAGNKATNGTAYEYELDTLGGVGEYSINLTGVDNTREEVRTWQHAVGQGSSFDVGGNVDPSDEYVQLRGVRTETNQSAAVSDGSAISVDGNVAPVNEEVQMVGKYTETPISVSGAAVGSASETMTIDGQLSPTAAVNVSNPRGINETREGDGELSISSSDYADSRTFAVDVSNMSTIEGVKIQMNKNYNFATPTAEVHINGTYMGSNVIGWQGAGNDAWFVYSNQTVDVSGNSTAHVTLAPVSSGIVVIGAVGSGTIDTYSGPPSTVSVSGDGGAASISPTDSTSLSLSPSSTSSVGISPDTGAVDYEITGIDRDGVEDVSVSVDGSTASNTGALDGSKTENVSVSRGSHSVSVGYTGNGSKLETTLNWSEVDQTESPAVDVAGTTVYHSGLLGPNETVTEPISLAAGNTYSADMIGGEHETIIETNWTETTRTEDATISVNNETITHTGQLTAGETVSLTTNDGWIKEGTNTVAVGLPDIAGPTPMVDFEYQHSADSAAKTVDVNATAWSESYNISNTFASEKVDATATLPFSGNVVGLHKLRVRENGGTWYEPSASDVTWVDDGPRVELALGDVAANTTVDIQAEARKIDVTSGAVDVINPTVGGDTLQTKFQVTDNAGENAVIIDISETSASNPDYVHYLSSSSWDHAATMQTDGQTQELVLPEANTGGTATAETLPFEVQPASGTAEVAIESIMLGDGENEQLQFTMSGTVTSTEHEIVYHETVEGQEYVLYSDSTGLEIDVDTPNSPVYLFTDGSEQTYTIIERDIQAAIRGPGAVSQEASGWLASIPFLGAIFAGGPATAVFLFLFGLGGIVLLARGVGAGSGRTRSLSERRPSLDSIRSLSLPSRSTLLSPQEWSLPSFADDADRSTRQRRTNDEQTGLLGATTVIILAGIVGLTLILLELSTPRSLTGTAMYGVLSGGFLPILSAIAILLVVWVINTRTESDIPLPVNVGIATIVLIWVLETLAPGVIVEALAGGLEDVSAIIWIGLLAGVGYLGYRWIQSRGGGGGGESRIIVDTGGEN